MKKEDDALELLTAPYRAIFIHAGKPRRVDGEEITPEQASEQIAALARYLARKKKGQKP